jgi:excisionase family DNA binding protein
MSEWLTSKEAAAYLKVTRRTLYRWMEEGRLRFYELASGRRRLRKEDLDALLTPSEPGGASDTEQGGGQDRPRGS